MSLNIIQDNTTTFSELLLINNQQIGGVHLTPHIGNFERRHMVWAAHGPVSVYDLNSSFDDIYQPNYRITRDNIATVYEGSDVLTPFAQVSCDQYNGSLSHFHFREQSQINSENVKPFSESILRDDRVVSMFDCLFDSISNRKLKKLFKYLSADGERYNRVPSVVSSWTNAYLDGVESISNSTLTGKEINVDALWAPNFLNIIALSVLASTKTSADVYLISGRTMFYYIVTLQAKIEKYWHVISSYLGLCPNLNVHVVAGTGMNLATELSESTFSDMLDVYLESGHGFEDLKAMYQLRSTMTHIDYLNQSRPNLILSELQKNQSLSDLANLEAMLKSNK